MIAHIARLGIDILMNSRCGAACTSRNEYKPLVTTYVLEKYEDS